LKKLVGVTAKSYGELSADSRSSSSSVGSAGNGRCAGTVDEYIGPHRRSTLRWRVEALPRAPGAELRSASPAYPSAPAAVRAGASVSAELHPVSSLVWVASAPPAFKEARMNNVVMNYS